MSSYDLIIVGLGPAGAYLGHRAHARGLKVLGVDRKDAWDATYGGWVDELPGVPLYSRTKPTVRFGGVGRVLEREYAIIDADRWRSQLLDFPIVIGEAEISNANSVLIDGQKHLTDVVVDARGMSYVAGQPLQQALGWFIDSAPDAWMDFRESTFLYSFDTPRGRLVEETYLAIADFHSWGELEGALSRRFPGKKPREVERVVIPLGRPPASKSALPFGARAGFINPITGFSLATAIRMAEPTLDALWGHGTLPWRTRAFRADRHLAELLQRALLNLEPPRVQHLLRALLRLPTPLHRDFLQLGNLRGTLVGMALVFAQVPLSTKLAIVRALVKG
ncbi:lycopene cyclase family protein [Corynebacterium sp. H128]|uniref:lycopene cyclase family protein n=1 Tax=Corynebacterium sp. H128 TaxID=3133427 RepID=UPI00309BA960